MDKATSQPSWIDASAEAVTILAERVEGNLLAAIQEIEKLKLLAVERQSRCQRYVSSSGR